MAFKRAGRVSIVLLGILGHLPLAGQSPEPEARRADPVLRVGVTYLGVDTDQGPTAAVELTYLGSTPRIWRAGIMGGLIASAQRTVYGYGGVHVPIPLPIGLIARPSFSVGLYRKGWGMDLGSALEFRSSLVLERMVSDRVRLSAMLFHLSNAGLGLQNPGMEAVGFAMAIPISQGAW